MACHKCVPSTDTLFSLIMADAIARLSTVVTTNYWSTSEVMFDEALLPGSVARYFVDCMCRLRGARIHHMWLHSDWLLGEYEAVTAVDVRRPRLHCRTVYSCMQAFFACYMSLWNVAAPRAQRPQPFLQMSLGRADLRVPSGPGLVP